MITTVSIKCPDTLPLTGSLMWDCACMLSCFSCIWLFVTPWTVARQAPLSMRFSRQGYWSESSCPPPGGGGLVAKSCLTLLTPWTVAYQSPLSMDSPGKNTGVGCHFLPSWCGTVSMGQSSASSWLWRESSEPVLVAAPASQHPLKRAVWCKPVSSVVAGFILQSPWQVG